MQSFFKKMTKIEREFKLREKLQEMLAYEKKLWQDGKAYIAGVDEVGRGPLAGPVVTAAVILPTDFNVLGINDSKKLSPKKREELYDLIMENALSVSIGRREPARIDEINILEATKEAMVDAINGLSKNPVAGDKIVPDHILIDALTLKGISIPQTGIIHGDAMSTSIAAASIIAKVTRDREMVEMSKIYPGYAFESNKGYGTKAHYEGLAAFGPTPIHRRSFL